MSHAVKLMLQLLDFSVTIFRDARSAARQLLSGDVRPELMVLDINMPEVSGIDLLEFLRLREDLRGIPVVMLSSETTDRQVDEALGLGADAFVFKPVTIEELEGQFSKHLQHIKGEYNQDNLIFLTSDRHYIQRPRRLEVVFDCHLRFWEFISAGRRLKPRGQRPPERALSSVLGAQLR
jgi:DNA-binding response OmpR family regulator